MTYVLAYAGIAAALIACGLVAAFHVIRRRLDAEAREEYPRRKRDKPSTVAGVDEQTFAALFVKSHAPRWMLYAAGALFAVLAISPVALLAVPLAYDGIWRMNGAPDWAGRGGYVYMFSLLFGIVAFWAAAAGAVVRVMHKRAREPFHHALARARGEPIPEATAWKRRPKWARRARPDA